MNRAEKSFIFCLLLTNLISFSQNFKIPKFNFEENSSNARDYAKMLNIKDHQCLFIKAGYQIYGVNPNYRDNFIVYLNNGDVLKYNVIYGETTMKIKKVKVRKKKSNIYWHFLEDCAINNRFKLDKNKLNSTWIPHDEDSPTGEARSVADGGGIIIEISQNEKHSLYGSENPQSYIKNKVQGYMERQKLLDLVIDFQKLFSKE